MPGYPYIPPYADGSDTLDSYLDETGLVVDSSWKSGSCCPRTLTVRFEDAGEKRLLLAYAPLKKVG